MKNLKEYLNEGLLSRKISTKTPIRYRPNNRNTLTLIIINLLKQGITNLNCIDVSEITDMSWVFHLINANSITVPEIDISEWDVSNVTNMDFMFTDCKEFNADISNWDTRNLQTTDRMFCNCKNFDCDLSKWDVSNLNNKPLMFAGCETLKKNNKIPKWY